MTEFLKKAMITGVFTGVIGMPAAMAAPEEIGTNAVVKGDVTLQSEGGLPLPAVVKGKIHLRDEVRTKTQSSLQVLLKDATVFTVGPDVKMTIDEFVYDPKSDSNTIKAKVGRGMFRYMSGNAARLNPDNITIETPTSTMGIRGTIFEAIVGPEALVCAEKEGVIPPGSVIDHMGSTLIVLRGPGGETNSENRTGEIVVTSGGRSVTLTKSGSATLISNETVGPSEIFEISEPLFGFFSRHLRTQPKGDLNYEPFPIDARVLRPQITIEDEEGLEPFSPSEDLDLPRAAPQDIELPDLPIEPDFTESPSTPGTEF